MYKWFIAIFLVGALIALIANYSTLTAASVQGNISLCLFTVDPLSAIPDQNVTVGDFYNYTIPCQAYCGESKQSEFIALPYGCNANLTNIQLNTSTHVISGTPNASEVGTFLMIVRCKTNCCWDTEMFYLTINPGNTSNQTNMTNVTLPAPNISISYDGNVSVNWSDENAPTYTVFYSSNISAIVLLNTSNVPANVYNVSGITSLNWTDLNHSDDTRRYYTVASVNGTFMNLSRDMPVGKNTHYFTTPVSTKFGSLASQYMSLYLENEKYTNASSLLLDVPSYLNPSISRLLKSNAAGEYFNSHVKGLAGNNFNLSNNIGYVLTVNSDYNFTVVGRVPVPPYILTYDEFTSNVFGSLASNYRGISDTGVNLSANSLLNSIPGIYNPSISRLLKSDAAGEYFNSYVRGLAGGAWIVEPGVGYVITSNADYNHTVKPLEVNNRW